MVMFKLSFESQDILTRFDLIAEANGSTKEEAVHTFDLAFGEGIMPQLLDGFAGTLGLFPTVRESGGIFHATLYSAGLFASATAPTLDALRSGWNRIFGK